MRQCSNDVVFKISFAWGCTRPNAKHTDITDRLTIIKTLLEHLEMKYIARRSHIKQTHMTHAIWILSN